MQNWHCLGIEEAYKSLESTPAGLGIADARERLTNNGPNELIGKGIKNPFRIIFEQLASLMVLILLAAGALSLFLGKLLEAGSIFAIVILFVTLGFFQEYRAEKAIAALKKLSIPLVRVRRNSVLVDIPSRELVVGDIVLLETGSTVPADLRLVEAVNLRIQESTLTGESAAVEKQSAPLQDPDISLGDRSNLAFMGTTVNYGRGAGLVVATGMQTELGAIAGMLQEVEGKTTPLQQKLDRVGLILAIAGVGSAAVIMLIGLFSGGKLEDMLLTAISVAVAVVPEGLPAILTFTLAMGAQRMLKRNALIRKLPAVETLGSVSVICSDKTGTLTQNRMSLALIDVEHHRLDCTTINARPESPQAWQDSVDLLLTAACLCNDAVIQNHQAEGDHYLGDPTETALLRAGRTQAIDKLMLEQALPRQGEFPFDSSRKRMSTYHVPHFSPGPADDLIEHLFKLIGIEQGSMGIIFTKGAVDGILPLATRYWDGQRVVALNETRQAAIRDRNAELAAKGMRVLGFAFRPTYLSLPVAEYEQDLIFIGLGAIIDPPRPEAAAAVARCQSAGIRPVMITGDHPLTALHIARSLGITQNDRVVTGPELQAMTDLQLALTVAEVSVFARVSPEHKLRIVTSLQSQGQVVAMTGDGVNDAPALKKADIGVAMGITGTDVAKEAAAMVLRDDNFATIVAAVEEGRSIYDNIRSYIAFSVAGNLGKVAFMLLWPVCLAILGIGHHEALALLPLQLLWLNLLTDGLLGLAIGLEPVNKGAMLRAPIARSVGIFAQGLGGQTLRIGLVEALIALAVGGLYRAGGSELWQTMVVLVMSFLQVAQALALRNPHISIFRHGLFGNRVLTLMAGLVITLQIVVLNVPILREALGLQIPGVLDFLIAIAVGGLLLLAIEAEKQIVRRYKSLKGI